MKNDKVYIQQIMDSISKIEAFVVDMDKSQFLNDQKTQSAVIMQLTLIGEISKKISETVKDSTNLPWKSIASFRDRAIHDYFGMDLDIVWDTVISDIPILKKVLSQ